MNGTQISLAMFESGTKCKKESIQNCYDNERSLAYVCVFTMQLLLLNLYLCTESEYKT